MVSLLHRATINKSNTIVVYSNYSRAHAYQCARHSMVVVLWLGITFRSSLFIVGEKHSELTTRQTSLYMYAHNSLCSYAFCTAHLRHNNQNTFIWIWEIVEIGSATGNVARGGIWVPVPPLYWNSLSFIMVALCNRADHYIFALWFLSSFFFFPLFSFLA